MKKIIILVIMLLIIIGNVKCDDQFSLLDYFSGEYTVYTSTPNGDNGLNLGFCYMNSKPTTKDVVGESIKVENLEIDSVLKELSARVVKTECLEDATVVLYLYTALINDSVSVFGKNVNLQIAIKEDYSVIGWPLILGSY